MINRDKKYPNLDPRKFFNDTMDDHIQPSDEEINELIYRLGMPLPKGEDYVQFIEWLRKNHPEEPTEKWLRA